MKPHEFVEGFEQIIARFGRWPSFHDGEVHRIVLDRTARSPSGAYVPTVELHLRGWTMEKDANEGGLFKQQNDSVVHFLFEDIFDFELEGFNQQNVLTCLNLALVEDAERSGQALRVELEHCFLFCGGFSARKAKVLGVFPYAGD